MAKRAFSLEEAPCGSTGVFTVRGRLFVLLNQGCEIEMWNGEVEYYWDDKPCSFLDIR
jgi:hypothetical protein